MCVRSSYIRLIGVLCVLNPLIGMKRIHNTFSPHRIGFNNLTLGMICTIDLEDSNAVDVERQET